MSLRVWWPLSVLVVVLAAFWAFLPWASLSQWAATEQRAFQNLMAQALRGIQAGDALAVWTLCAATAAYGFVHALGPGHGKILLGGAAMASGATFRRLTVLTLLSSVAQAGVAIVLVGSLVFVLRLGSRDLVSVTENWLAPLSYAAIAVLGVVLIVRGARAWPRVNRHHHHHHDDTCGCGHAHGPSVAQIGTLTTKSDALALIASIAMRPCTGALFVLVIAARFEVFWIGALAVLTMGLGTASFNLMVAGSGFMARKMAGLTSDHRHGAQTLSAALHIIGGVLIAGLSAAMVLPYLT